MLSRCPVVLVLLAAALAAPAGAQLTPNPNKPFFLPANVPNVAVEPVMDGKATSTEEWIDAMRLPDSFFFGNAGRSGYYYFEAKQDWNAVPVGPPVPPPGIGGGEGDGITYPGTTTFVAHDIIGSPDPDNPLNQFQVDDPHDWNSFCFPVPSGLATIWVFDDENDPDDSNWLPFAEGLDLSGLIPEGADPDLIDDRGFIARLNGDPETDVHWFEGMPEPGDLGWVWEDWHYVFGRHTFGTSFQDELIDLDPENDVPHEVYEACAYRPDFGDDPPPWCLWWVFVDEFEVEVKEVIVLRDGTPTKAKFKVTTKKKVPMLVGQWWWHFWDPEDPVFGIGIPNTTAWRSDIFFSMSALIGNADASEKAKQNAFIGLSFLQGFLSALENGDFKQAFQQLKQGDKYLRKGHKGKQGLAPLLLVQSRMRIVALAYYIIARLIIDLDTGPLMMEGPAQGFGGVTMDDKNYIKASRGMYKFGLALQKFADKGTKGQDKVLKALKKLKPVTKAIEKMQASQAP